MLFGVLILNGTHCIDMMVVFYVFAAVRDRKDDRWLTLQLLLSSAPEKCLVQLHSVERKGNGITNK